MKQGPTWLNTSENFGRISRFLHWLMALWMVGLLVVGLWMVKLPAGPFKFEVIYPTHKMFGVLFLGFVAIRLAWRWANVVPEIPKTNMVWRFFANASVPMLYLGMMIMPISGFIMSDAGGHPVSIWGYGQLPHLLEKNEVLSKFAKQIHDSTAWIMIGILCAHVLAALIHHFIFKDQVLRRMISQKRR